MFEKNVRLRTQSVEKRCFLTEECRICESKIHGQSCIQIGSSLRPCMPPSGSFFQGLQPPKTPGEGFCEAFSCNASTFLTCSVRLHTIFIIQKRAAFANPFYGLSENRNVTGSEFFSLCKPF